MSQTPWIEELPVAVTVCDLNGKILEMNAKSAKTFEADGGKELLGRNLFDCHSESSRIKLRTMIDSGAANTYTIEKGGVKKLIHQVPWFENGQQQGLVELSIEIPFEMSHFNRDNPSPDAK